MRQSKLGLGHNPREIAYGTGRQVRSLNNTETPSSMVATHVNNTRCEKSTQYGRCCKSVGHEKGCTAMPLQCPDKARWSK